MDRIYKEQTEIIRGWIKEAMEKDGVTYRDIAGKMGCSAQNVWQRLNGGPVPTVKGLRDIIQAFGHDFIIMDTNDYVEPIDGETQEKLLKAMEETNVSYPAAQAIMAALGWSFIVGGVEKF